MARLFLKTFGHRFNALLAALLFAALARQARAQTNMTDFLLTRLAPCNPTGIVYTPSNSTSPGAYWFTEYNGGAVGRIDTVSNVITEIVLTNNPDAGPYGIIYTPDSNVWFTEAYTNRIARLNPAASNYLEFQLSNNVARYPSTIVWGPDSNLWFAETGLNRLGMISPNAVTNSFGNLVLFESPPIRTNSQVYGLTVGPDRNLWFTETSYGVIGRYNIASNSFTEFFLPVTNTGPFSIVTGSDGALWFTEYAVNVIGRITVDGRQITEYPLPVNLGYTYANPFGIINGPDGNLWFAERNGSAIGRITTSGIITIFPTSAAGSYPNFLATGADSNIWFTEYTSAGSTLVLDRIGRLIVAEALNLSAPSRVYVPPAKLGTSLIASFKNSDSTNTVVINWGDGTASSLIITNSLLGTNYSVSTNPVVTINSARYTNFLEIANTAPLGTNFSDGSFNVYASHTFPTFSNYLGNITVTDSSNNLAFANVTFQVSPLAITDAGANVLLSWPTAVTNVSLYQNSNLLTTNWTRVINSIFVTNGFNQVAFPISAGTDEFFRLQ